MSLEPVLFLFLRQGLVTAVLCRLLLIFLLLSPILLQECWDQHHIWPLSNLHSHAFMASTLPIEALSHLTHIPNCGGGGGGEGCRERQTHARTQRRSSGGLLYYFPPYLQKGFFLDLELEPFQLDCKPASPRNPPVSTPFAASLTGVHGSMPGL